MAARAKKARTSEAWCFGTLNMCGQMQNPFEFGPDSALLWNPLGNCTFDKALRVVGSHPRAGAYELLLETAKRREVKWSVFSPIASMIDDGVLTDSELRLDNKPGYSPRPNPINFGRTYLPGWLLDPGVCMAELVAWWNQRVLETGDGSDRRQMGFLLLWDVACAVAVTSNPDEARRLALLSPVFHEDEEGGLVPMTIDASLQKLFAGFPELASEHRGGVAFALQEVPRPTGYSDVAKALGPGWLITRPKYGVELSCMPGVVTHGIDGDSIEVVTDDLLPVLSGYLDAATEIPESVRSEIAARFFAVDLGSVVLLAYHIKNVKDRTDDLARVLSSTLLEVRKRVGKPVITAGDMNIDASGPPDGEVMQGSELAAKFTQTASDAGVSTHPLPDGMTTCKRRSRLQPQISKAGLGVRCSKDKVMLHPDDFVLAATRVWGPPGGAEHPPSLPTAEWPSDHLAVALTVLP